MEILKRLVIEEDGQGMTEYALILGFVVFGIWVAVTNTDIGGKIAGMFTSVGAEIDTCALGQGNCAPAN